MKFKVNKNKLTVTEELLLKAHHDGYGLYIEQVSLDIMDAYNASQYLKNYWKSHLDNLTREFRQALGYTDCVQLEWVEAHPSKRYLLLLLIRPGIDVNRLIASNPVGKVRLIDERLSESRLLVKKAANDDFFEKSNANNISLVCEGGQYERV